MLRIQYREFINWQELDCSDQIFRSFDAIGEFYPNLTESRAKVKSKGKLILDATCAPADIKFPTDISLLNAGRERMEAIIADLHTALANGKK